VLGYGDRQTASASATGDAGLFAGVRRLANRRLPLVGEMAFIALVIGAWELARIPSQGSESLSLAHARDWLALEHALFLDFEAAIIRFAHHADLEGVLHWGYYNFHLPVLFGFMALARQLRPERYPFLRSVFVLSHIPAILVISLYPLLPPRWVPGMPFAVAAPPGMNGGLHNATAAAASQHVGYPLFIAAATVWLADRARWSWLAFLYPAAVYLIVVGTANHYTLDAIVGGLCMLFGVVTARVVNGPLPSATREATTPVPIAVLAALGFALVVRAFNVASQLSVPPQPVSANDLVLLAGIVCLLAAWGWSRSGSRGAARWRHPADGRPQDARSGV
jgi:hypothetical protein